MGRKAAKGKEVRRREEGKAGEKRKKERKGEKSAKYIPGYGIAPVLLSRPA